MVGEVCRRLGHAPRVARGADAPAFAGEGDQEVVSAVVAAGTGKAVGKDAAFQVLLERFAHVGLGAAVVALARRTGRRWPDQARSRSARPRFGRAACARGGAGCRAWALEVAGMNTVQIHSILQAEPLQRALQQSYRHGFVTDVESDCPATGPGRRHGARHLAPQARARVPAAVAPGGLRALAVHGARRLGPAAHRADRLPGPELLLGTQVAEGRPQEPRRRRPQAAGDLREARRAAARARPPGRRGGRRGVRLGVGRHHLPRAAGRSRRDLLFVLARGASTTPN
jgi:hypothetical protein